MGKTHLTSRYSLADRESRRRICLLIGEEEATRLLSESTLKLVGDKATLRTLIRLIIRKKVLPSTEISYQRGMLLEIERVLPGRKKKPYGNRVLVTMGRGAAQSLANEFGVSHDTITDDAIYARGVNILHDMIGDEKAKLIRRGGVSKRRVKELAALPREEQQSAFEQADLLTFVNPDSGISVTMRDEAGKLHRICYQLDQIITTSPEVLAENIPDNFSKGIDRHLDKATEWLSSFRKARMGDRT